MIKNIQKSDKKSAEKISFDIADALNESHQYQKTYEIPSNFNKPNESLTGLNKVSEPA